jgi:hypothetical protein
MVRLDRKDDQLSVFVGHGLLTPDELIGAYANFLDAEPTALVLWDLSSASLAAMGSEDLLRLANRAVRLPTDRRKRGKSALVVGADATELRIGRALLKLLSFERYPVRVEIFQSVDEAKAWLLEAST